MYFSIAISAFNALTFSPMLSGLLLRSTPPKEPRGPIWIAAGVVALRERSTRVQTL